MFRDMLRIIPFFILCFPIAGMAQVAASGTDQDTTLANQCFAKAEQLAEEAEYDSSTFYFEKASALFERAAIRHNSAQIWLTHIKCYNGVGDNFWKKGEYDDAMRILKKALELALNKLGKNHPHVAYCYNDVGVIYESQGDYDKALEYFNEALALRIRLLGKKHADVANTYNNLGVAYFKKGNYDKALEFYNKASAIDRQTLGENHPYVAHCYNNIGLVYESQGDYDKALDYHKRALAIRLQKHEEIHPDVANSYNNMGRIYENEGNFDKALEYYKKTLSIDIQTVGENHPNAAESYYQIGKVHNDKGEYDTALEYLEKSLAIRLQSLGENNPNVANCYHYLGVAYDNKGDYGQAFELYNKALTIGIRALGEMHPDVAQAYQSLGELYLKQNNLEKALSYAQKSILSLAYGFKNENYYTNPSLTAISSAIDMLYSLKLKAEIFKKLYSSKSHARHDIEMSLSTYQLSADLIDKMRSGYQEEGSKLFLGGQASEIYDAASQTSLQIYDIAKQPLYKNKAFYFAEKGKAAILSQSLQDSRAKEFADIPIDSLEKERNLKIDLAFYETEIQKEKLKAEHQDRDKIRTFESRYFARSRKYESLIGAFEKAYPQYYDLKYKIQTASVSDLQKSLNDATALVEYFLGDSAIYIFAITRDGFDVVETGKDSAFSAAIASLANSFKNVTSKAAYLRHAAELYQLLVKPVEQRIADKFRWVIIPDGELHQIPFEALLPETVSINDEVDYKKLNYLIKQHEISYHYSASLLLKNWQEQKPANFANLFVGFAPVFSKWANNGNILFADPTNLLSFTVAIQDKTKYLKTRDGKTLDELPQSEHEVRAILAMFPKKSRAYLHDEASEENFKRKISGYKYVHVATHGVIIEESPKLSHLAFSQPQNAGAAEDGYLHAAETYNLDLGADLLVLSSCESGTGKLAKGEGLLALTRGFLYSGARNIIASLWKVYDQHTSQLMVEIYRQIAAGKSYSAALREAKLKMIANPETAGPQSWASFVLIGK